MSPDTNNNLDHDDDDHGDSHGEDEDDDDEEPVFKFSPIIASSEARSKENSKNLAPVYSCIAVHEKFLVMGKMNGEIVITDHMGHAAPQYQIRAVPKED
jgi:hypothetical protein